MEETGGQDSTLRYFLLVLIPTVVLLAGIVYFIHDAEVRQAQKSAANAERVELATLARELDTRLFQPVITDLLMLSEEFHLKALLDTPSSDEGQEFATVLLGFARHKGVYDQIRLIDNYGQEVIRVNGAGQAATLVEPSALQNKSGRYYFVATWNLDRGATYVSPFDLNVEHNEIERPHKPVIRFGTPVFDSRGRKRGILILNYLGSEVLARIEARSLSGRQLMLINDAGYWLKGPNPEQEWGFMVPGREAFTFARQYPGIWPGVSGNTRFQRLVPEGLFTSETVTPYPGFTHTAPDGSARSWKLVSLLPRQVLLQNPMQNLPNKLLIGGFLLLLAVTAALAISNMMAQRSRSHAQLRAVNHRQETLIAQLKQAQGQLVQSEKMAGIGQLAAGVAHEINNPVGFVGGNVNALYQYTVELLEIIDALDTRIAETDSIEQAREQVARIKQQYELDYLREDIAPLLSETQDGIARIKRIVADLKGFARASDEHWDLVDLHREIDSTLNLVWNELKYHCKVEKRYGELPAVECIVSEINQVIMNLLVNASQAIEEKGNIVIRTGTGADSVWVEIEDDGKGIAKAELNRIFEPFFTTKPVGKGTGLGLSISYGITKKHGGRIDVTSEEGRGSIFRITLPIRQETTQPKEAKAPSLATAAV